MAAITTAAAGNWSDTGTWTGGIKPVSGDTVTINHAVTVNEDFDIGHSPAAGDLVAALLVSAGGLTFSAGRTCKIRGDWKIANVGCTINASAGSPTIIEFDASSAGTPSTARYVLQIATANSQANALLTVNGVATGRVLIRSNAGGANARITDGGFIGGGRLIASHMDLTRMGDASNSAITQWVSSGSYVWSWINGVADTCGRLDMTANPPSGSQVTFENITTQNCLNTTTAFRPRGGVGANLLMRGCVFDKRVDPTTAAGWSIENVMLRQGISFSGTDTITNWDNVVIENQTTGSNSAGIVLNGTLKNSYSICSNASNTNPHHLSINPSGGNITIDNFIFEVVSTNITGDCLLLSSSTTPARNLTVRNSIKLPNGGDGSSGAFVSALGNANHTVSVENCVVHLGGGQDSSGIRYSETYSGHKGIFSSIKGNIFWDTSVRGFKAHALDQNASITNGSATISIGGWNASSAVVDQRVVFRTTVGNITAGVFYWVVSSTGSTIQISTTQGGVAIVASASGTANIRLADAIINPADVDYNNGWNFSTTNAPNGYGLDLVAGSAGVNDLNVDPQFVDQTRDIAKWDLSLGGAGTAANALSKLAAKNTPTEDPSYTIAGLIAYIRAGFVSRNSQMSNGNAPNGYIGISAPQSENNKTLYHYYYRRRR